MAFSSTRPVVRRWRCDCLALVDGTTCAGCGQERLFGTGLSAPEAARIRELFHAEEQAERGRQRSEQWHRSRAMKRERDTRYREQQRERQVVDWEVLDVYDVIVQQFLEDLDA